MILKLKFDTWGKTNVFNVEKNTDKPSTRTVRVRVCAYGVRASPTLIFISYPGTYSRIRSFVADMTPSERKRYSNFKVCIFFLFFIKLIIDKLKRNKYNLITCIDYSMLMHVHCIFCVFFFCKFYLYPRPAAVGIPRGHRSCRMSKDRARRQWPSQHKRCHHWLYLRTILWFLRPLKNSQWNFTWTF